MAARFPDVTNVLKYSVKAKTFGQGSFGTVHKATDEAGTNFNLISRTKLSRFINFIFDKGMTHFIAQVETAEFLLP